LCEIVFNATVNHFWNSESELDLNRVALTSREAVRPTTIRSQKERDTALNAASGAAIGFAKKSELGTNQLMNVVEELLLRTRRRNCPWRLARKVHQEAE
jgi:hypothetical protein